MTSKNRSDTVARPTGERRRARRGDGELLREEILHAAEQLLVAEGDKDAVTVRAVAKAVGVSAPSIYLHFADKDELFYFTCRRVFEQFNARLVEALAAEGTVVDRMMRAGRAYVSFGLEHQGQYETLFGSKSQDTIPVEHVASDPGVHAFSLLVALIQAGVDEGELRDDLDVQSAAIAVWSAVHGTVNILLTKRGMEDIFNIPSNEVVIEATLEVILNGLRKK